LTKFTKLITGKNLKGMTHVCSGSLKRSTKFPADVEFENTTYRTSALGSRPLKQTLGHSLVDEDRICGF
jgi:hypothetical protein